MSEFVSGDELDFSLVILLGLKHLGLGTPRASGPPWNSAFKTLSSLNTAGTRFSCEVTIS